MNHIVLLTGLSVLLFGTPCSASSDHEARLASLRNAPVERDVHSAKAASAEQLAREQTREARLAELEERNRQGVLRVEEVLSDSIRRIESLELRTLTPEAKRWAAEMLQRLHEQRSTLQRIRAAW